MPFRPLAGASDSQKWSTATDMFRELFSKDVTQIFKDDNGTRRVLLGKGADGFYGLKVSQEGADVFTADDDELIFNSNQNVFKIVQTGTLILPQYTTPNPGAGNFGSGQTILASVSHGLGYIPAAVAFLEFSSGLRAPLPYVAHGGSGASATSHSYIPVISSSAFRIDFNHLDYGANSLSFADVVVRYYLLQESAD